MPWSTPFFEPIALPRGRPLVTLRDAGNYIRKLPAAEQRLAHWQLAAQWLLLVAERGGDTMMPRAAMLLALRHGEPEPAKAPGRKRARAYRIVR